MSVIVPQIIQIYQNLLSIKFVEIKGDSWHTGDAPTIRVHLRGGLKVCRRCPEIFRLEEGRQGSGRLHWILLPRFVPEE